jgi:uncharacterized membrane protein
MQDVLIFCLCAGPLLLRMLLSGGKSIDRPLYGTIGLALAFGFFALGHFAITDDLAAMLPPWVPEHRLLVLATGVPEILIALALITRRYRRLGGLGAATLLVLFFPVNVYAALHHIGPDGPQGTDYLWVRTPLQLFLLAWTLWPIARPASPRATAS